VRGGVPARRADRRIAGQRRLGFGAGSRQRLLARDVAAFAVQEPGASG
jgi:hypothetical protein